MPFDATPSENPENTGSKTTLPDSQSDCLSLRKHVEERVFEESQPKTYIEPHVSHAVQEEKQTVAPKGQQFTPPPPGGCISPIDTVEKAVERNRRVRATLRMRILRRRRICFARV